jgi:hypothetical protein
MISITGENIQFYGLTTPTGPMSRGIGSSQEGDALAASLL